MKIKSKLTKQIIAILLIAILAIISYIIIDKASCFAGFIAFISLCVSYTFIVNWVIKNKIFH